MVTRPPGAYGAAYLVAALTLAACRDNLTQPTAAAASARAVRVDHAAARTRARCGQPTHVWVRSTSVPSDEIDRGATVWFTGVVAPGTAAQFRVRDAAGAERMQHTTRAAAANCVIAHEPEARSTYELEPGVYAVYASYVGVNPSTNANEYVAEQFVQQLRVREPAAPSPVEPCPPPPDWPPEIPWPGVGVCY